MRLQAIARPGCATTSSSKLEIGIEKASFTNNKRLSRKIFSRIGDCFFDRQTVGEQDFSKRGSIVLSSDLF